MRYNEGKPGFGELELSRMNGRTGHTAGIARPKDRRLTLLQSRGESVKRPPRGDLGLTAPAGKAAGPIRFENARLQSLRFQRLQAWRVHRLERQLRLKMLLRGRHIRGGAQGPVPVQIRAITLKT